MNEPCRVTAPRSERFFACVRHWAPKWPLTTRVCVEPPETTAETAVTVLCENIPRGARLEDNEAGSRSTLSKLAAFVE
jgi:hypothetical protein